jgi:hypothetical protein
MMLDKKSLTLSLSMLAVFTLISGANLQAQDFRDDFNGPAIDPRWTVKSGSAWIDNGWLAMQDDVPDSCRHSLVVAGEGANWGNYHVKTHFNARGQSGTNWYSGITYFHVQEIYNSSACPEGTYYALAVATPLFDTVSQVFLFKRAAGRNTVLLNVGPGDPLPSGVVINDHENTVDLEMNGNTITIWINDVRAFEVVDSDPIPTGGVGLGATLEARTDYDYIAVGPLTSVGPAKMWVGLKNSDAVGLRLDIRTEAVLNGNTIAAGEVTNVAAGSSGFNNARLHTIPMMTIDGGAVDLPPGATVALQVSVRRTCSGTGHNSGTVRLWFNGAPVDGGPGRDAGSRVAATIHASVAEYFLRSGFVLSPDYGSSRQSIDVAVNSSAACPARPYVPFGTWTMTLP